ncbi:MAG: hypothetical protein JW920_10775 [Deltaproteobacteria bacterium]|nr:hypothetical protein [Deltaproteobacteria bacterium]
MDFRATYCIWCPLRQEPIKGCYGCPKYLKYGLNKDVNLDATAFCTICVNEDNPELAVFCRTNRYYQADTDEPFECYNFCPATPRSE